MGAPRSRHRRGRVGRAGRARVASEGHRARAGASWAAAAADQRAEECGLSEARGEAVQQPVRLGDQGLVEGLDQPAHYPRAVLRAAHSEETATCKHSSGREQGLVKRTPPRWRCFLSRGHNAAGPPEAPLQRLCRVMDLQRCRCCGSDPWACRRARR